MAVTKGKEQARRVFANYCKKTNETVGGAQVKSSDGKQYVGNHFMICRYVDKVDGLEQADRLVDFKKYIDELGLTLHMPYCLDDIKPVSGSDNKLCTLGKSGICYDYIALKKMLKTFGQIQDFGINQDSKLMGKGCYALLIKDTDGNEGFILALRPKKD